MNEDITQINLDIKEEDFDEMRCLMYKQLEDFSESDESQIVVSILGRMDDYHEFLISKNSTNLSSFSIMHTMDDSNESTDIPIPIENNLFKCFDISNVIDLLKSFINRELANVVFQIDKIGLKEVMCYILLEDDSTHWFITDTPSSEPVNDPLLIDITKQDSIEETYLVTYNAYCSNGIVFRSITFSDFADLARWLSHNDLIVKNEHRFERGN